ncbi:LacI family transcriptional regulator [Xylanibacillus composti]|nr:LacI family transcriptional regulator [Xylanibacillus composti]
MKITIDVVAQKAGVSKTTVSRILNGNYAHTSEKTRNRVLQVMKELDYRPNALAKGLKSLRTDVIGILLSNLKNPFWATVLEGVEDACRASGYNLMICNSDEDPELEFQAIRQLQMRQVDGVVMNPTMRNPNLYRKLVEDAYPLVVMNRRVDDLGAQSVVVDNVKGASLAVEHLLRCGKRRPAVCYYANPGVTTWQDRVEGYRLAMKSHGYGEHDLRVVEAEQSPNAVKHAVLELMKKHPDTDAVFSTNNMMTLEVIEALKELGLRIPADVAVLGYDDTVWAKHMDPPLTTVRQPGYEMGKIAANLLIQSIRDGGHPAADPVVLQPELVIRRSCGWQSS